MPRLNREAQNAYMRAYTKTMSGRAAIRRYQASEKGKANRRRKTLSVAGRASRLRFARSTKGKLYKYRENLRHHYGISGAEYDALLEAQKGLCAICLRPEKRQKKATGTRFNLSVDHDHRTGKVRGLLCSACNQALGHLDDSPHLLRAAAAYLERP